MAAVGASLSGSGELSLPASAHLSRYRGISREHTESDLRLVFTWCQERQLAPLGAQRSDLASPRTWRPAPDRVCR